MLERNGSHMHFARVRCILLENHGAVESHGGAVTDVTLSPYARTNLLKVKTISSDGFDLPERV
jgi:hypothetical protein